MTPEETMPEETMPEETMPTPVLSYGEKAVGLSFNPSGDASVQKIKELYAQIIDIMDETRQYENNGSNGEKKRLASTAITQAQGAQMRAVKALTWKD